MAPTLSDSEKIRQLIRTSEAARNVLGDEIRTLKYRLDVPARMKDSLRSHPTGWLGGSVAAGLASSLLFRRKAKREKTKRKGIAGLAVTLGLAAARPAIQMWASGKLKDYLAAKLGHEPMPDISARRPRHVAPF
jgi:hypothetical protein